MSKKLIPFLIAIGTTTLLAYLGYYLYTHRAVSSIQPLHPPLANVNFPTDQIPYPVDWPEELKFPDEFVLVDSSSGTLPKGIIQGWAAKFRYKGNPSDVDIAISSFLIEKGWSIIEKSKLDSGGYSILIMMENGTGIIAIDKDPNKTSQSLIIVTIFP